MSSSEEVLSEEKNKTNWKLKNLKVLMKHLDTESTHGLNTEPAQHMEGRLHTCPHLEDSHIDVFCFLFDTTVLNGSAFIYEERRNNVTPKPSATTHRSHTILVQAD